MPRPRPRRSWSARRRKSGKLREKAVADNARLRDLDATSAGRVRRTAGGRSGEAERLATESAEAAAQVRAGSRGRTPANSLATASGRPSRVQQQAAETRRTRARGGRGTPRQRPRRRDGRAPRRLPRPGILAQSKHRDAAELNQRAEFEAARPIATCATTRTRGCSGVPAHEKP
ncbi:hypothetical protein ACU686_39910 [Yinghuangia aomiensis]